MAISAWTAYNHVGQEYLHNASFHLHADELGSGMRNKMKYGKAYGGEDPQMIEGMCFDSLSRFLSLSRLCNDQTKRQPEMT